MKRVAALILSHNDAATVAEAVSSIRQQPRAAVLSEVVLADDASRDDTVSRARAAGASLPLQVWAAERNLGQWPNLNRALEQLTGSADWVLILHADDVVVDGWLDAMLDRIGQCGDDVASICCSWDMRYGDRVEQTGERHDDAVRLIAAGVPAVHDTLLSGCWWKISGAALRLEAFRAVGPFDASVPHCGDWDWSLRALSRGWSFEYVPRVYVHYRQHAGTISTASLREDVEIADALTVVDRFGDTLNRRELIRFHGRRGYHTLRRTARGVLRLDARRVLISLRTWTRLGVHLARQLAS